MTVQRLQPYAVNIFAAMSALAARLDAPVVQTVNARGLMWGDPLSVAASPSLPGVRALIADADQILALGTEIGQTDYDMYVDGRLPDLSGMIRADACPEQLARRPARLALAADAGAVIAGATKIEQIALMLKSALQATGMAGLKMNAPKDKLEKIISMLPAITSPTVCPLHDPNWYSLEIIIHESQSRDLIPELLRTGARGIIEYPLKKVLDG